jgi:hypothetical protein
VVIRKGTLTSKFLEGFYPNAFTLVSFSEASLFPFMQVCFYESVFSFSFINGKEECKSYQ